MLEDYNSPWVQEFLENQAAQQIEDKKYPEGHLLREVTVVVSGRPEDRMRANLQASIERRQLKDARDRYTLLRNMNQAQEGVAHNFGLPLIMGAASPFGIAGWTIGSAAAHDAASRIGPTAEKIVSGAELGLMALGAGAAGGRALLNNTNWGRAYLLSKAIGKGNVRETPTFGNNEIPLQFRGFRPKSKYVYPWQQPSRSTLTAAERAGIPKGERNFRLRWHVAYYPGYLLKGLMKGSPLERLLSKLGTISINLLNAYFNKASQIEREVANKVLAEKFSGLKTIDYNLFKKAVLDELITYSRKPLTRYNDYGIDRLGFKKDIIPSGATVGDLLDMYPGRFQTTTRPLFKMIDTKTGRIVTDSDELLELIKILNDEKPYKLNTFTFESTKIPTGSVKHYDYSTLGHSRTYTTSDEPDVLHVMESQSDWGQSKKHFDQLQPRSELYPSLSFIHDHIFRQLKRLFKSGKADSKYKEEFNRMLQIVEKNGVNDLEHRANEFTPEFGEYVDNDLYNKYYPSEEVLDRFVDLRVAAKRKQHKRLLPQISHLHDNYLQRQLLENLKYAAEHGQTKMRYPTSETAAKIEGYIKDYPANRQISWDEYNLMDYSPEHKTILKKYADFPKLFLKLFKDLKVRTVTDAKGNTWYEVDIPKGYLSREWQFKFGGRFPKWFKKGGKMNIK